MEARDPKELGFDRDGNYVGLIKTDEKTHYDVMHNKYKQCARCKRWYLESEYPREANGKQTKCCDNCLEALKKAQEARKAKKHEKAVEKEVPSSIDLSQVPPQELIKEMQRRGWKGHITVSMDFEL